LKFRFLHDFRERALQIRIVGQRFQPVGTFQFPIFDDDNEQENARDENGIFIP
jgi:hypothetical protein